MRCPLNQLVKVKRASRGFTKQHNTLPSGSHFGEVRSRNQSAQAVSLHRPPSVVTLVSDDHNVPAGHRELVASLNGDRRQAMRTRAVKREPTALCSLLIPEPRSRRWPCTPRCTAATRIAREPPHKVHPTSLLRTQLWSWSTLSAMKAAWRGSLSKIHAVLVLVLCWAVFTSCLLALVKRERYTGTCQRCTKDVLKKLAGSCLLLKTKQQEKQEVHQQGTKTYRTDTGQWI